MDVCSLFQAAFQSIQRESFKRSHRYIVLYTDHSLVEKVDLGLLLEEC